jgi:glycerol-3-phosphate dehydrogenase
MTQLRADVLVIGGGATGAAAAWDAALRGFDVVLVDRADLAQGTSGRFHGLLHSGGRYVVKDPLAAEECVAENVVLRRVLPAAIEDTGGLFVSTPDDDPAYGDRFLEGCRAAGMPVDEVRVAAALRAEPRVNPRISRAFAVQDGAIDVWKAVRSLTAGAAAHGARILTYHTVLGLHTADGAVTGAHVRNELTGEEHDIDAAFTLNAAGAWAAQIVRMAGIEGIGVIPGKGIMIAMNHRLVNTVVNRCTMPSDGDILVPIRTVSVIGTTDVRAADPDEIPVTEHEVNAMLDDGERLVPGLRQARALRVWAGVRPLFQDDRAQRDGKGHTDTRDVSRTHAVVDHAQRDGVQRLLTMSGGKLTTMRLMAQDLVDAMCAQLGADRPCRTAHEPPPGDDGGRPLHLGDRLRRREATLRDEHERPPGAADEYLRIGDRLRARELTLLDEQLICECELIGRGRLEDAIRVDNTTDLDDLRRRLRLGMGPCQGGFCMYRTTALLHAIDRLDGAQASASLVRFLQERWKGVWPILYGDQLRQARLDDWIFQGLRAVEDQPQAPAAADALDAVPA